MARLYFLCPDFEPPSGGTRTLYWYVASLQQAGFDAVIVHHSPGFRLTWHGIDAPVVSPLMPSSLKADDVLLFPESATLRMRQFANTPARKVAIALNWVPHYYAHLPANVVWSDFGISAILTPSVEIARYLEWRMADLPVTVIPGYINPALYQAPSTPKQPLVTYISRKSPDTHIARAALERQVSTSAHFRWQALDSFPEAEYAQYLKRSLVYIAPSATEGLNVSLLEAMACGCLVVGYSGIGGNEYLVASGNERNVISVENGNLPELGLTLRAVLETLKDNPHAYDTIVRNGLATAARYQNRDRELNALATFFDQLLTSAQTVHSLPESSQRVPQAESSALNSFAPETIASLAQTARQLKKSGQLQDAYATYQRAIALDRTIPELWFNLGNVLQALQNSAEAETAYHQALALKPDLYPAHLNLANALRDRGRSEDAIEHYQRTFQLQPDCYLAYRNLGQLLLELQRYPEAIATFEAWGRAAPNSPGPHNGMGISLQGQGQFEAALKSFQNAYAIDANQFATLNNLGTLLRLMHRPHDALPYLERAVQLDPLNDVATSNLGHALLNLGRVSEAIARMDSVLERNPNSTSVQLMRGHALVLQARAPEAAECFERCWEMSPTDMSAITNAMFSTLYRDDLTDAALYEHLCKWAARIPQPSTAFSHPNRDLDPHRKLKVGYLSGDLRSHPVTFFLEPILTHHDAKCVEVTCYHTAAIEDVTSDRLRQCVSQWRACIGWSDERIAHQILADEIDILVDLSGHTQGNRACVLTFKPAPIQMLYIGFPSTSAMASIDYIISDDAVSPPENNALYTEDILRVEGSFWCFKPHEFAPDPGALPAIARGFITFGSFNNSAKLSPSTLQLWAQVMAAVPNAKLLLKALAFADPESQVYFRHQLVELGVESERLLFEPPTLNLQAFFEAYQRIDIALDPTPYNGGTTTCEALWMGVPVITMRGQRFVSRMSHSFLGHVGLAELSTSTPQDYVAAAVELAGDRDRLATIRATLRERMKHSPICDAPRAARELEEAYRKAWKRKCDGEYPVGNYSF